MSLNPKDISKREDRRPASQPPVRVVDGKTFTFSVHFYGHERESINRKIEDLEDQGFEVHVEKVRFGDEQSKRGTTAGTWIYARKPSREETERKAKDEANEWGERTGVGIANDIDSDDKRSLSEIYDGYQEYETQSSDWSNWVLPELRRMAGFKDSGVGTYMIGDDDSEWLFDILVEGYWGGVWVGLQEAMPEREKYDE